MDFEAYLGEVEEARHRGWALDAGIFDSSFWGVSAPASPPGGPVNRVVNAFLLAEQSDGALIERIARELQELGRL